MVGLLGFLGDEGEVEDGGAVVGLDQHRDIADAGQHALVFDQIHPSNLYRQTYLSQF